MRLPRCSSQPPRTDRAQAAARPSAAAAPATSTACDVRRWPRSSYAVTTWRSCSTPLARTAELLGELLDAPVSTGWLCAVQQEAAAKLAGFVTTLKGRLSDAPVVHADETGTRVGLTKHWVHTLATNLLTLLVVHPKRGVEALEDIGILGDYTGTVVHDGSAPYEVFAGATHAQCEAHLLRHLASVGKTPAFATVVRGDDRDPPGRQSLRGRRRRRSGPCVE